MIKQFLLSPISALFNPVFYRDAIGQGRVGKSLLFLLYLTFFYVLVIEFLFLGIARRYVGRLDDGHILFQFLSAAPKEWRFGEDGLTLASEDGTIIPQWNFEDFLYIDTSQSGDFVPPKDYMVVASKTLLWSPVDQQSRALRFRELRQRAQTDVTVSVFHDRSGQFDHVEIMKTGAQAPSMVGRADFRNGYRVMKSLIFFAIFIVMWPLLFIFKAFAVLMLSLVGLVINALSKRNLRYSQIFTACALIQAPAAVVDLLASAWPVLAPIRGLAGFAVAFIYLIIIFYRFLSPPDIGSGAEASSGQARV